MGGEGSPAKSKREDIAEPEEEEHHDEPQPQVPVEVFVHSLPLLSTVDHYTRLNASTSGKRVVGVLLGHNINGKVHCTNSFAVPFEEDQKNPAVWYFDTHYLEDMFQMFKKVNAKEAIVGWYSTGPKLRSNDLDVHQVTRKYCTNPVYVIIRVNEDSITEGLPCTAYVAVEKIEDERSGPQLTFVHLPTTLKSSAMEEVGVVHLLRDIQDYTVSSLATQVKDKVSSLRAISAKLEQIREYLQMVVDEKLPMNHNIMYQVQDIFNTLPSLHLVRTSQELATETNDSLMTAYIGMILRAVIALHNLILNKFELKKAKEEAEAKKKAAAEKKKEEEEERKRKEAEKKKEEEEKDKDKMDTN